VAGDFAVATPRPAVNVDDARITYRTLRIGMVAVVVLLAVSITMLAAEHHHVEGSISAYYYTQAHAVFIAAVCALGICLVVYRGHTPTEDVLLDVAGILAFVVAFVPTRGEDIRDPVLPTVDNASVGVDNNIWAVLAAVAAGLLLYRGYAMYGRRRGEQCGPVGRSRVGAAVLGRLQMMTTTMDNRPRLSLAAVILTWILPVLSVVVLLMGGGWFLRDRTGFTAHAHGRAATVMFLALTVVVLHYVGYAARAAGQPGCRRTQLRYTAMYAVIALVMLVTVILAIMSYLSRPQGGVAVFGYEVVLISSFSAFWLVQTRDLWHRDWYADDIPAPAQGDPHHTDPRDNENA